MASLSIGPFLQHTAASPPSQATPARPPATEAGGTADAASVQTANADPVHAGTSASEMAALAATIANWTQNASTPSLSNVRGALDGYAQSPQADADRPRRGDASAPLTLAQAQFLTRPLTAPISRVNLHV